MRLLISHEARIRKLLLALAKHHMSNICNVDLHAGMSFPIQIFAAWLNSNINITRMLKSVAKG